MSPRFSSKVDWWLAVIIALLPIVTIGAAIGVIRGGGSPLVALAPVGLVALVFGGALFPLYYQLDSDAIVIRSGLMRSRIPYASLRAVRPTRNPLSSPALSLDRLHLDSGNPLGPNVSPRDREGFYATLLERAPHLRREGDALVSR